MAKPEKRIGKDGKVSWRVRIRRRDFPTQSKSFRYKADADRWIRKTEAEMDHGEFFISKRKHSRTFSDAVGRYEANESKALADGERRVLQLKWWVDSLGPVTLLALCKDVDLIHDALHTLQTEVVERTKNPRSPATVKRYLAALSKLFSCAMDWGWCDSNPVSRIQKPSEPDGRVRYLSEDERVALLEATEASDDPYLHSVVLLALCTGGRLGEVTGITWPDVSFDRQTVTFRKTKNRETRTVPVTVNVLERLKEMQKVRRIDCDLVFPRFDGVQPKSIRAGWSHAVEKAGLPDFRFHDLRHTAASYLAMTGATPTELAAILGHKSLAMVARYSHVSEQHTSVILRKMASKYLN